MTLLFASQFASEEEESSDEIPLLPSASSAQSGPDSRIGGGAGSKSISNSGSSAGRGVAAAPPQASSNNGTTNNSDFEIAEILLGRQATVAEVAQLRAAFAQAADVEVSHGEGTSTASGASIATCALFFVSV